MYAGSRLSVAAVAALSLSCASTPEPLTQPNVAMELMAGSPAAFQGPRHVCIEATVMLPTADMSHVILDELQAQLGPIEPCFSLGEHVQIVYSGARAVVSPCSAPPCFGRRFADAVVQVRNGQERVAEARWHNNGGGAPDAMARAFARALAALMRSEALSRP